ncbi:hypothetical protein [Motilibacter aurantiacus]|uniref:hypothetical protein n=1 Tax=Motilibacter aurantiacus TaxID=2714955 RepID=UPI00140D5962|nr:hypothetical protein [Motilibacter aurantiacus]NHC44975.1 hypothetical protein [Motilibacter aurantiacus]
MTYFPDCPPDTLPYTLLQFRAAMARLLELSEAELQEKKARQAVMLCHAVSRSAANRERLWQEMDYIEQAIGIKQLESLRRPGGGGAFS